ncbi:MAG: transcriptional regulator [Thermoproteota archaeon]|nr:MAG: transcriptional regulator [Candidatus Korarchaeota archaeon]
MTDERLIGLGLVVISLIAIIVYGWLLFFSKYSFLVLKVTAFVAILVLFCLIAWVGYIMAASSAPKQGTNLS